MTAPAVGHRPPDSGPDLSLYDYRHPDPGNHPPSPPDSDSAGSAMQVSASDRPDSPSNLPSVPGMFDIKTEPSDYYDDSAPDFHQDNNMRRQSAASALLAQLLGGQSSTPADGTEQPVQQFQEAHSADATREIDVHGNGQLPKDEGADLPMDQNQVPGLDGLEGQEQGGKKPSEEPRSDDEANGSILPKPGPVEGLSDPLMSRIGFGASNIFPFDITAAPRTPFEALQQNELLTAAYLSSQSADLTALGYSHGAFNQNGASSIAGSEPRIQAFAKLEFDDGHFYVNTYSFVLGRDVRAARAAHQREAQARQAMRNSKTKSSSGGNASHTPVRMKHDGSNLIGSVVSDRGGIMGFDPDVPPHLPPQLSRRSSNSSYDPPLHATPAELQTTTDYNALAMQSLDDGSGVKPVDTLSLLPSPESCPTIPIHPPSTVDGSAAGHRGISRKHVKIAYNFDKNLFEMEVMGRNGAFIGADFLSLGQIRPLHSGDYIQIGGVRIRFLLPDVPVGETGADRTEEPLAEEDDNALASVEADDDIDMIERRGSDDSESKVTPKTTKIILKTKDTDPAKPVPSIEGSGDSSQPARRRGPGRPPKDGIMSKRERAELAREQKLAAKREANGGVTPPPNRSKGGKTTKESVGAESPGPKPEKRKYTKRKKPDGTPVETPFPSVEGGAQTPVEQRPEEYVKPPPVKKRKPSRSPSPNYPPESAYTPEDLAKPPYNYAVLIFDALTEAGMPMTLKQIYRALKLKYPYFRFKCETEGWTSSVRHNLNGNGHLFMHAERDGKGWSWQLRPGASVEKEKKRRPSPPPPSSQPPPTPTGQHYMPPMNQPYNPPSGQTNMANQHFQFPSMPSNPYNAPAPQHSSPYPPPPQVPAPFPIPSPIRNNLPPAFAQTTPSTYTSPYASDPPPQLAQFQQSQNIPPPQPPPSYYQPPPPPPPPPPQQQQQQQIHPSPQPQNIAPHPGPPVQQQANPNAISPGSNSAPMANPEPSTFKDRANKAIDDFEAVLMEDYEDKNYIREVLRSARARALGDATESSVPGGEPEDEGVILDVLRNLVGSLKDE